MSSIVDFGRLQAFTNGDQALEAELCSLFIKTATRYLDELAQHHNASEDWRRAAHSLKGAAGNFGATAMADLAELAEHQKPDTATLAQLQATFAATKETLERTLR